LLKKLTDLHLSEPDPVEIYHRIRLSGEWTETEHIYNISVDIEDPLQVEIAKYLAEENCSLFSKNAFVYNIRSASDIERGEQAKNPIAAQLKKYGMQFE
jgi:hypothetical protein